MKDKAKNKLVNIIVPLLLLNIGNLCRFCVAAIIGVVVNAWRFISPKYYGVILGLISRSPSKVDGYSPSRIVILITSPYFEGMQLVMKNAYQVIVACWRNGAEYIISSLKKVRAYHQFGSSPNGSSSNAILSKSAMPMRKFLATGCTAVALIMGFGFEGGLTPYTLSILSHVPYYSTITSHIEEDWAIPDGDIKQQIEELAFCESSNQADVVIVDTNGYYSYGVLQFQYPTFQQYIRRYDLLPNVEEAELKNWILDADLQKYLAYRMISEDQKNWYHWRNCAKVIQAV